MEKNMTLSMEKSLEIRFSEVDMMQVVWHGSYILYMEDAREAFGAKYGLSYHKYIEERIFAPLVDIRQQFKRPIRYGMKPVIRITYRPCEAAKIIFDYEIFDPQTKEVFFTATTTQVFMERDYSLMWESPEFYQAWKKKMGIQQ